MKKKAIILMLLVNVVSFSQKNSKTLVTINDDKISIADFKRVYEKNLDAIDNEESKDVNYNLDLFINYKLKVAEAYQVKLDTVSSYQKEMETYKNQLSAPYLQDKKFTEKLLKEAYFRSKNEIKAKHILIRVKEEASPKDTLAAYNKILEIRNRIVGGESFEKVAEETSEDPSARDNKKQNYTGNKGDLGYFSAFKMVYNFEDAAYNTKVGEVSMPFRTKFGYHIVTVDGFRASKGEVEVAHVLVTDTSKIGKQKIEEAYAKLNAKVSFEEVATNYSNDEGSRYKGGKLRKFGQGRMVPSFDKVAFSLKEEDDFSKPFQTRFGWHIVKLIKKHPVKSFDEMKDEITSELKRSGRMRFSDEVVYKKLKKKYTITENESAKEILKREDIRSIPKDSLSQTLFTINDKEIKQVAFVDYLKNRRHKSVTDLFEMFKKQEIIKYFKDHLIYTEPEYATTLKEYQDGLLLFELMQQKIWDKSSKDTLALKKFFVKNKTLYKTSELDSIKGKVINDYQNFLEKNWIADLRKNNKVKIHKRRLKKLIKSYQNK